jgi:hypothetical protein
MTVPPNIMSMIQQSERIHVEFKRELDKGFREHIMAFANRYGGHILVGVNGVINPDGSQTGQLIGFESENIDADKQRVDSWARTLRPTVTLLANQEYQLEDGRWLLHVQVKEQTEKPVGTDAGLYKIRTHSGDNPMDHGAMRAAIFEEERTLKSLQSCLHRNITHANAVLQTISQGTMPVTVFEKGPVIAALSAPDVYEKVDQSELAAIYQAYEVVDRLLAIKITWRPISGEYQDIDKLIRNHTQDVIDRSSRLLHSISTLVIQSE